MKKNKIFVACDSTNISKIKKIIEHTSRTELKIGYKFGLEFLNSKNGRNFVSKLKNKIIFADLKLHDIPNTCVSAIKAIKDLKVKAESLMNLNDFIKKVAIFDWDVHHGNGTENIIKSNKNILYTSIHQYPLYPGTGFKQEKSTANNILNIPMPAKTDWLEYKNMFYNTLLPKIINFKPDLIIISAGFDAHKADGIANFELSSNNFGEMTSEILKIQCKCLFGLEGGYNLNALAKSVEQVVLMNILFKDY